MSGPRHFGDIANTSALSLFVMSTIRDFSHRPMEIRPYLLWGRYVIMVFPNSPNLTEYCYCHYYHWSNFDIWLTDTSESNQISSFKTYHFGVAATIIIQSSVGRPYLKPSPNTGYTAHHTNHSFRRLVGLHLFSLWTEISERLTTFSDRHGKDEMLYAKIVTYSEKKSCAAANFFQVSL